MKSDVITAHGYCSNNRKLLVNDRKCGCFYCLKVFSPEEITEWIEDPNGMTAVCPHCGVDSVIGEGAGYPMTEAFLRDMRDHWF